MVILPVNQSTRTKSSKIKPMTYASAGVDIDAKSKGISKLVSQLSYCKKGTGSGVSKAQMMGNFCGGFVSGSEYIAMCTDGVGTKILVARDLNKYDTIGIDCIAMNVNDMICIGARPMAFVDYIAIDKPDDKLLAEIGKGLNRGARLSDMDIVGGEVAVLPEIVNGFDIAGTAVGSCRVSNLIDGSRVKAGDIIIGLQSSGIHSNGLTLARKIVSKNNIGMHNKVPGLKKSVGAELLEPTSIYVNEVLELVRSVKVHAMANITGGGLRNLLRLGKNVGFEIDDAIRPQPIFEKLSDWGNVSQREMYQTFNMGMGYAAIVQGRDENKAMKILRKWKPKVVGSVVRTKGVRHTALGLEYTKY